MEIIAVIESIEDDSYQGKDFKKVTLKDGSVLKVKYGREGLLKAKWGELQVERAFKFIMGDYQGKPFVQDFIAVEGKLPESKKPPTPESALPKPHVSNYIDSETAKIRSICVAYAKDAWIADKIEYKQIYSCADMFLKYVRNEEVK